MTELNLSPTITDEERKERRESGRIWYGLLADDNVDHIVERFRRLLLGNYYTVVTNNADYHFSMPEVRTSQFISPFTTTYGEKSDGFLSHHIGDATKFESDFLSKTHSSCGISLHDCYGMYGISSSFANERDAWEAYRSGDMDQRRLTTHIYIEGGHSDDPREQGSRDRIEIEQYNMVSPAELLQWTFAPERHWDRD